MTKGQAMNNALSEVELAERLTPEEIVNQQADDDGLWFVAETCAEAYLQQELRKLHAAVEARATKPVASDEVGKILNGIKVLLESGSFQSQGGTYRTLSEAASLLQTQADEIARMRDQRDYYRSRDIERAIMEQEAKSNASTAYSKGVEDAAKCAEQMRGRVRTPINRETASAIRALNQEERHE